MALTDHSTPEHGINTECAGLSCPEGVTVCLFRVVSCAFVLILAVSLHFCVDFCRFAHSYHTFSTIAAFAVLLPLFTLLLPIKRRKKAEIISTKNAVFCEISQVYFRNCHRPLLRTSRSHAPYNPILSLLTVK